MSQADELIARHEETVSRIRNALSRLEDVGQRLVRGIESLRGSNVLDRWYDEQVSSLQQALDEAGLDTGVVDELPSSPFASLADDPARDQVKDSFSEALERLEEVAERLESWLEEYAGVGATLERHRRAVQRRAFEAQADFLKKIRRARATLPQMEAMDDEDEGAQRRRSQRVEVEVPVSVESGTRLFFGSSENISEAGLFVATPFVLPPGTDVVVNLLFAPAETHNARARVVWMRQPSADESVPAGMGLRLLDVDDEVWGRLSARLPAVEGDDEDGEE